MLSGCNPNDLKVDGIISVGDDIAHTHYTLSIGYPIKDALVDVAYSIQRLADNFNFSLNARLQKPIIAKIIKCFVLGERDQVRDGDQRIFQ